MQPISYNVAHAFQPTPTTCAPTALAMILSFLSHTHYTTEDVTKVIPVDKNNVGEEVGSTPQNLAIWAMNQGFKVEIVSFDTFITDYSWIGKSQEFIQSRLEVATKCTIRKGIHDIEYTKLYTNAYLNFMKSGGMLTVAAYPATNLIQSLLKRGPLFVTVCFNMLHASGKNDNNDKPDDINGSVSTHVIVVNGFTVSGKFTYLDPWQKPGKFEIEPEQLIAAIMAAEIEYDNFLLVIEKP